MLLHQPVAGACARAGAKPSGGHAETVSEHMYRSISPDAARRLKRHACDALCVVPPARGGMRTALAPHWPQPPARSPARPAQSPLDGALSGVAVSLSEAASSLLALSDLYRTAGARAGAELAELAPRLGRCALLRLLGADELGLVVASVRADDTFALALTCRALRAARAFCGPGQAQGRPLRTSTLALASSTQRLCWGLACGAQLSAPLCAEVAGRGELAALIRLRAAGCPWDHKTCVRAAQGGHFAVLRWAHAHGCPTDLARMAVCCAAAKNGDLSMLQWLFSSGFATVSYFVSSDAAAGGHLAVLEWLHGNGWCEWKMCTFYAAACHGHLHVLRWMVAHGFPWSAEISSRARDCIQRHCTVDRAELLGWLDLHDGCLGAAGAGAAAPGSGQLPFGFF